MRTIPSQHHGQRIGGRHSRLKEKLGKEDILSRLEKEEDDDSYELEGHEVAPGAVFVRDKRSHSFQRPDNSKVSLTPEFLD